MGIRKNSGNYTTHFTPREVGDWMISILYAGQHIQGSLFNLRVYDVSQVKTFLHCIVKPEVFEDDIIMIYYFV